MSEHAINNEIKQELLTLLENNKRVTNGDTRERLGLSPAYTRAYIHALRLEGVPICSSNKQGYWIGDREEVAQTIAHLKSRIRSMRDVVDALERCTEPVFTQQMNINEKDGGKYGRC